MTIQNAREKMFRTSPSAMSVDGDFFRKIDAKADKLGASGHPADWRRLRQEVAGWLENHVKKEPFNAADHGAYEHAMARLDFIDGKIKMRFDPRLRCPGCVFTSNVNMLDDWKVKGIGSENFGKPPIPHAEFV